MDKRFRFDILTSLFLNRYIRFLKLNYSSNNITLTKEILDNHINEFMLYIENKSLPQSEILKYFIKSIGLENKEPNIGETEDFYDKRK